MPVFDYHRHCPKCLYDLCLDCCRDIRRSQATVARGEHTEGHVEGKSRDSFSRRARLEPSAESVNDNSCSQPMDLNNIDIRSLVPTWRVSNDGSLTCGPHEHSHKVPGSTGSRNEVEGRGSSFYKIVVRRGYTSMER